MAQGSVASSVFDLGDFMWTALFVIAIWFAAAMFVGAFIAIGSGGHNEKLSDRD